MELSSSSIEKFTNSQQSFRILQIGEVEAFGETAVDVGEHRARFIAIPLLDQHPREAQFSPV
jgi:hypothetical protein